MDRVGIENIVEKSNCGLGSNTPSLISNTFRFAIPLNPPYQRGTFQIEVLSHLEMIAHCHYICSIFFQVSYNLWIE